MGIPTVTGLDTSSPVAVTRPEDGGPILIPDAELLFKGDYSRQGSDLLLTGKDGATLLIPEYFSGEGPVALVSPAGAMLKPEVVEALAGPLAPGQYAQAGAPAAAEAIGQVETITGGATATRADGSVVQLAVGLPVFQGDVLQTGSGSALGVTFADGTVFAMTADARMVLNSYVYQAQGSNNSMLFNLVEGGFTFLAGQVAPSGDMRISTPVATMGIRGTTPVVTILEIGTVRFSITQDPDTGRVGSYELLNAAGDVIATVTNTATAWVIESVGADPVEVPKSGADFTNQETAESFLRAAVQAGVARGAPVGTGGGAQPGNGLQQQEDPGDEEGLLNQDSIEIQGLGASDLAQLIYDVLNPDAQLGLAVDQLLGNLTSDLETSTGEPPSTDQSSPPPTASGPSLTLPGTLPAMIEDTPTTITGFTVTGSGILTITITAASTVTLASLTGLVFTIGDGTGDEVMQFSGTAAEIMAALNGLTYDPTLNNDGPGGINFVLTNSVGTTVGTLGFDLVGTNDPPVVAPVTGQSGEDALPAFSADLLAGSSDPDTGAVLTVADPAASITTDGGRVLTLGVHYTISGSTFALTADGTALFNSLAVGAGDSFTFDYDVNDGSVSEPNTLTVTVTGANDAPIIEAPNGGDPATLEVAENIAAVTTVEAFDPDTGAVLTYSISGGADAGLFQINALTGELSFIEAPNFESEGDNSYVVDVQVSDGLGGIDTQTITVNVTDINEPPTATPISDTVGEDGPAFSTDLLSTANDPDAGTVLQVANVPASIITTGGRELTAGVHYTVVGATFALTAAGFLLFNNLPAGATDAFTLGYDVTDGLNSVPNSLIVTVNGANDAPTVTAITASVGEDGPTFSTSLLTGAADPDTGAVLSVTGVPGSITTAAGLQLDLGVHYTVTGSTFALTEAGFALFNSLQGGATDTLVLNYQVSDGIATTPNTLTLTVDGANDPPTVTALTATAPEDGPFSTSLTAGVTDPDGGTTFSIVNPETTITTSGNVTLTLGTDYEISGTDFVLTEAGLAKFNGLGAEETDSFTFDFAVSDGTTSTPNTLTVTVDGANDDPVITAADSTGSILEENGGQGTSEPLTPISQGYLTHGNTLVDGLSTDAGYGTFGEEVLLGNDDGSTPAIDITSVFGAEGLNFFGTTYTSLYINNNGNITFEGPLSTFTPSEITAGIGNPIIAAFWGDVDTRTFGGETTPGGTSTGANIVLYDLDSTNGVLTVTWNDVTYFAQGDDLFNAFQMQLISTGNGNFDIVFRYEAINWTTGDASGGEGGLGGIPARAGYNSGNGEDYFEIPGSGSEGAMLALPSVVGNTGIPGVFVFHVVGGEVVAADLTTNGTIQFTDADNSDTHEVSSAFAGATGAGGVAALGTLALVLNTDSTGGVTGQVTWTYTVNSEALDFLAQGQQRIETFDVTIDDGNGGTITQQVSVTLTGTNDVSHLDLSEAAAGTGFTTNYFTETDTPVAVVGSDIAITDVDSTSIASATVVLANASFGDALSVLGALPAGISSSISSSEGTITLTLTGNATLAAYETALQQVRYENTSGEPSTADRVVQVTVNDGFGQSNTATTIINYGEGGGGNQNPVAADDSFNVGENGQLSAANVSVFGDNGYGIDSDPDGDGITVSAATYFDGSVDVSIALGEPTVLFSGGSLTLNADGTFSYDTNGAFDYLGETDSATETFEYTISDGKGGFDTANVTITIEGENDAPTLDLSGVGVGDENYSTTFTIGESPSVQVVAAGVDIADVDNGAMISSATVMLTNGGLDDFLFVANEGAGVPSGITFNTETPGQITFTGQASLADYETALQQVLYDYSGEGGAEDRIVQITVNDGLGDSNTAATTISIEGGGGGNNAPQFLASLPDVVIADSTAVYLSFNDGLGTFSTPPVEGFTVAGGPHLDLAVGDIDGDFRPDILLSATQDRILLNNGEGGFTVSGDFGGTFQTELDLADIDRDGDLDVAFVNNNGNIDIYRNDGANEFSLLQSFDGGASFTGIAFGDFNGDGYVDFYASTGGEQADRVYFNEILDSPETPFSQSDQGLIYATETYDPQVADLDNDGDLDIVVADNTQGGINVLINGLGSGNFGQSNLEGDPSTTSVSLGDVTGDGFVDAVVSFNDAEGAGVRIWTNNGEGNLAMSSSLLATTGGETVLSDVDGDGDLDIILGLTASGASGFAVYENVGEGAFTLAQTVEGPEANAIGVINVDGFVNAVPENLATNLVIAQVTAVDPDVGDGTPQYAITAGNDAGLFSIDASGNITLNAEMSLDYETAQQHVLTVTATDIHDASSETQVTIHVTDVDDEDFIVGTANSDLMRGGFFNDTLVGDPDVGVGDNDFMYGNDGDDTFRSGFGHDTLDGGAGSDTADYSDVPAQPLTTLGVNVFLNFGGYAEEWAYETTDTLISIENVIGSAFDDQIEGDNNNNVLEGGSGEDSIFGGGERDTISGGDDNDDLSGGGGGDTIRGDGGNDTVVGNGGDDVLFGGTGNDSMGDDGEGSEGGDDRFDGGAGDDTINGGGGFDVVQYHRDAASGGTNGVTVDLGAGTATDGFGDTDTLANIEGVRGTEFVDILTGGNPNSDDFERFEGLAGADQIDGGSGSDQVAYQAEHFFGGTNGINANLISQTVTDTFGSIDMLVSIEEVRGSAFNDIIVGNEEENFFIGGAGDDNIAGGDSDDIVSYIQDANTASDVAETIFGTAGVTVNLAAGTATDGYGDADTLSSIEIVVGTNSVDSLTGGNEANDSFESFGGLAGNDVIDGGSGFDITDYHRDERFGGTNGVDVNLVTGQGVDGFGDTDSLTSIEGIRGTTFADTMTGGNAASDAFERFEGNGGDDLIDGGSGFDQVAYHLEHQWGGSGGIVADLSEGTVTDTFGNTDTIISIEGVRGSQFADLIIGDGFDNEFFGEDGDDTFVGGDGDDYMDGGGGADWVDYSNNSDGGTGQGVDVDLSADTGFEYEFGTTDTLNSIQNVIGTAFMDLITGGSHNNQLWGGQGSDELTGNQLADIFGFELEDLGTGVDTVTDYTYSATEGEGDLIDLEALLTDFDSLLDDINDFVIANFDGVANSDLYVDQDGTGGSFAFEQVASLNGVGDGGSVSIIYSHNESNEAQVATIQAATHFS